MENEVFAKINRVVGLAKDGNWSQVFWYQPEEPGLEQKRGKLFAVCDISTDDDYLSADFGKSTFEYLKTEYFKDRLGVPFEILKQAVDACIQHLKKQLASAKLHHHQEKWRFNLCAGVVWGKVLYLVLYGDGRVQIIRNNISQTLLSGENSNLSESDQLKNVSGYLEDDDLLIIATSQLAKLLPADQIFEMAKGIESEELTDILSAKIGSYQDGSLLAALIVKIRFGQDTYAQEENVVFEEVVQEKRQINLKFWPKLKPKLQPIIDKLYQFKSITKLRADLRPKKILPILLAVLILIFVLSVVFNVRGKLNSGQKKELDEVVMTISDEIGQAEGLLSLNSSQARLHFLEAEKLLSKAKELKINKKKLKEFEEKIAKGLESSKQVIKLDGLFLFYDLNLIKTGASAKKLSFSGSNLLTLDDNSKAVLLINKDKKSAEILAGGEQFQNAKIAAVGAENAFVLTDNSILSINLKTKQVKKAADKENGWGNISDLVTYTANFYLLDADNNQIYKYAAAGDIFGKQANFIKNNKDINFKNAVSMAIDGLVWVADRNGQITKLVGGEEEVFNPEGIPDSFVSVGSIDGDDRANNLYILDSSAKRIVVISKEGQYQLQYQAEELSNVTDIAVDEPEKKIFALAGNKIFSIDIK